MPSLDFVFTGGSACCVLNNDTSDAVLSDNYKGECLVFSSEVSVVGLQRGHVRVKKIRVTLTPDRVAAYVECGIEELNEVYLVKLNGGSRIRYFKLVIPNSELPELVLKEEISVFEDLDTLKEVEIQYTQLDDRGNGVWRVAIGKEGEPFESKDFIFQGDWKDMEMKAMYPYYESDIFTFSCFCDEIFPNLQANGSLKIDLLVQKKEVMHEMLEPETEGDVYKWKYKVFVFEELDTDTDESTSEEETSQDESLDISDISFVGTPGSYETPARIPWLSPARVPFPSPTSVGDVPDLLEGSSIDSDDVLSSTPSDNNDLMAPPPLVRQSALSRREAGRRARIRRIQLRFAEEQSPEERARRRRLLASRLAESSEESGEESGGQESGGEMIDSQEPTFNIDESDIFPDSPGN